LCDIFLQLLISFIFKALLLFIKTNNSHSPVLLSFH